MPTAKHKSVFFPFGRNGSVVRLRVSVDSAGFNGAIRFMRPAREKS
jgi:hypothetical protein